MDFWPRSFPAICNQGKQSIYLNWRSRESLSANKRLEFSIWQQQWQQQKTKKKNKNTVVTAAVLAKTTTTTWQEESNLESCNLPECIIHWVRHRCRYSWHISQTRQSRHNCKCFWPKNERRAARKSSHM